MDAGGVLLKGLVLNAERGKRQARGAGNPLQGPQGGLGSLPDRLSPVTKALDREDESSQHKEKSFYKLTLY